MCRKIKLIAVSLNIIFITGKLTILFTAKHLKYSIILTLSTELKKATHTCDLLQNVQFALNFLNMSPKLCFG